MQHRRTPVYPHISGAGAEPGVTPHQGAQYSHFKTDCLIDIIDFDADDVTVERVGNADFIRMMKDEKDHPRTVRWINIAGIDWEVLSSMALRYHIHALSLEDVLHDRGDIQSKVDYYPDHMFIRVLCHSVLPKSEQNHIDSSDPPAHFRYGTKRRHYKGDSETSTHKSLDLENLESGRMQNASQSSATHHNPFPLTTSMPSRAGTSKWKQSRMQAQAIKLDSLTAGDRPHIHHDPMCIFLFLDGTVISLMPTPNLDFTAPITERLYNNHSILRVSEDPSLLMEALLDLVVDRVLEVIDDYQGKIHNIERDIILNPNMDSIRCLHVLSGDLIMHKLMLEPIKTMIYKLREEDARRCLNIAEHVQAEAESDSDSSTVVPVLGHGRHSSNGSKREQNMSGKKKIKKNHTKSKTCRDANKAERSRWESAWRRKPDGTPKGYLSYTTKIYLADVADHMDFAMTSIDMFAGVSDNLVNYAFNVASYETNRVMTRLTIVTIIFLPPSLLTGYFGMSFNPFKGLDGHSVALFWEILLPVMAVVIPLFMFHEVRASVKKVITFWNVRRSIKA